MLNNLANDADPNDHEFNDDWEGGAPVGSEKATEEK